MAGGARGERSDVRYNPFAFPSDTDFRFWLLISTVLGSSLLIYRAISNTVVSGGLSLSDLNELCASRATQAFPGSSFADRESWVGVFNACEAGMSASRAWVLVGVAVLVAAGLALYLAHPLWRRRRRHLVPLTEVDAPELLEELARLCSIAGLSRPPAFAWNPLNMARSGVAFGTPRRRTVALTGGLATTLWTDPDVFRAVVLHELAHIRNGDLDKAYLTLAAWWAFVVAALLPFAVLTLTPGGSDRGSRALSLAALGLVVFLLRNATLRAREIFADVRASAWPGYAPALDRILPDPTPPAPGRRAAAVASLRLLLGMHPSNAARRDALRDTAPLFRLGWPTAVAVGFAGALGLLNVASMVDELFTSLLFAGLVTAVIGLALWRATFLAEVSGRPLRGVAAAGLGLAAGFALGDAFSLLHTADFPPGFALTGAALLLFDVVWYGLLLGGAVLFVRWLAAVARTWLTLLAGRHSPRRAYALGILLAVPVLAVGFWQLFVMESFRLTGGQLSPEALAEALASAGLRLPAGPYLYAAVGLSALLLNVATNPLVFVVAQLLWALPLAPLALRQVSVLPSEAPWATLDGPAPLQALKAPPVRVRMALVTGLFGGGVFWVLSSALVQLLARASLDAVVVWLAYGTLALGTGSQIVVALVVAARAGPLSTVLGIFAGVVCGLVEVLATMAVAVQVLGAPVLRVGGFVSTTLFFFAGPVLLFTVPAAGLGAAFGLLRRGRKEPEPAPVTS